MQVITNSMATIPEAYPTPEKSLALESLRDAVRLHFTKSTDWREEIRAFALECLDLGATAPEISQAYFDGIPAK